MSPANWWYDEDTGWHVCGDCNERDFVTQEALFQHLRTSSYHIWCETCDREFNSIEARNTHWTNSKAHSCCRLCLLHFNNDEELDDHQEQWHPRCGGCNRSFGTEAERESHAHWYCSTHKRCFRSGNDLKIHLMSTGHVLPNVSCPTGCGKVFISHYAAMLHLESDTYSSGITRERINYYIRKWDKKGWITTGRPALPAPPSCSSRSRRPQRHVATEASWSPTDRAYKCYFDSRLFSSLTSLNQHLSSAVHTYTTSTNLAGDKLYHCPNKFRCGKEILTLSGLMQHIEMGNCGVKTMGGVEETIDAVMGRMNRMTL